MCEHLATNQRLRDGAHHRLKEVWSKLQLWKLLDREFDLCVIIDTDTMAIQPMNESFWHEAPGAVWSYKARSDRQTHTAPQPAEAGRWVASTEA